MNKITPKKLKELFDKGINISSYLRNELNEINNSSEIIETSYDLQAGTYMKNILENNNAKEWYIKYSKQLAIEIKELCEPLSILEAGVGEASTFGNTLDYFHKEIDGYGFDISFSRLLYAQKYLDIKKHSNVQLCTGNLFDIPFLNNSIDVVYTSHTIEPNRGREKEILKELYRVTKKYLILLEPAYELSEESIQKRMDEHAYCKNLLKYSQDLGFDVVKYELFKFSANSNNPTAILIIKKKEYVDEQIENKYACPRHKTPLELYNDNQALYSSEALSLYPIINNIPLLRIENSLLATKLFD